MGQASGTNFTGCIWLRVCQEAAAKVLVTAAVISRLDGRISFQPHFHDSGRASENVLLSSLVWAPSQGCLTTLQLASSSVGDPRETEREYLTWRSQSFYNINSEVISHHVYRILFIRSKWISSEWTLWGEGITQRFEHQGVTLEATYHIFSGSFYQYFVIFSL